MEEEKKCFGSCLFDLSFRELITMRIIKALYVIGILIAGMAALCLIVQAFSKGFGPGLLHVIAAPIVFIFLVIVMRVCMELVLTLFKIEENTRNLVPAQEDEAPAEEPESAE